MGKVYKDKRRSCAMCKPHKRGWEPKKKAKVRAAERNMDREIESAFERKR
jgi:hypothetical protein